MPSQHEYNNNYLVYCANWLFFNQNPITLPLYRGLGDFCSHSRSRGTVAPGIDIVWYGE